MPAPTAAIVALPPGSTTQFTVFGGPALDADGPVTVTVAVEVQFNASVTVTVSIPALSPVMVEGPVKPAWVTPLDHLKVQGL